MSFVSACSWVCPWRSNDEMDGWFGMEGNDEDGFVVLYMFWTLLTCMKKRDFLALPPSPSLEGLSNDNLLLP